MINVNNIKMCLATQIVSKVLLYGKLQYFFSMLPLLTTEDGCIVMELKLCSPFKLRITSLFLKYSILLCTILLLNAELRTIISSYNIIQIYFCRDTSLFLWVNDICSFTFNIIRYLLCL